MPSSVKILFILLKNKIYKLERGWVIFLSRIVASSLVMTSVLYFLNFDIVHWRGLDQIDRFINLFGILIFSAFSYFGSLWLLGLRLIHLKG